MALVAIIAVNSIVEMFFISQIFLSVVLGSLMLNRSKGGHID